MEPYELWKQYTTTRNPAIKEQLILEYISLVQKIANKVASYLPQHVMKEDLHSYGIFGLLDSIDRYNPDLGIAFASFAVKRIKGAMIDGIRREDWVPASLRRKTKLLEQVFLKLEAASGRNATDEEVARELKISEEELARWLKDISFVTILSLDEPLDRDEDMVIKETITDEKSPDPSQYYESTELKSILAKAVGELPEKERLVISLFYYNDLSNKEIARVMELSDSRISQLHTKGIFRLRGKLARMKKLFNN